MKYKNGDKVKIVSNEGVYSCYLNWLADNSLAILEELPYWVYNREIDASDLEDEWTVVHSSPHLDCGEDILVFISNGKKSFIIEEKSLVSKDDSDYDAKDILKQLVNLIEENKELFEKAKKILESV